MLLDLPQIICFYRLFKRLIYCRNDSRPDLPKDYSEKKLPKGYYRRVWEYPKAERPIIINKLKVYSNNRNIIIFKSQKEIDYFIKMTRYSMNNNR